MKTYTILIIVGLIAIVAGLWVVSVQSAKAPTAVSPITATTTTTTTTSTTTTTTNTSATLVIGRSATIQGTTIGILGLAEDSRCPVDVQCIQAGTVRVRASIDSYNKDFTFTLSQPQVVGNTTITLVSVVPAQKYSQQTVKPGDYRFTFTVVPKATPAPIVKACTMEAKLCPDGSAVGRTGPNCEFAPCPANNSGVRGTVMLGPTCPVMREPPDPSCADKPYETTVVVYQANSNIIVATGSSDANGAFAFPLAPGSYRLATAPTGSSKTFPTCSEENVTVVANAYATANISCDTGIR